MIARKSKVVSSTAVWPYTPEPSPPLEATHIPLAVQDMNLSNEQLSRARPISVASKRDGTFSQSARPTLDDVLNNRAPAPYTLAAYTAFLSQQHCLETLEFVTEARKYSEKYDESIAAWVGMPFNTNCHEGLELMQDWIRILDVYVKPGAPREINLPAEERDDLLDYPYESRPPPGEALDPAVKRMYDLMSGSIFIPFCNSLKVSAPHANTYSASSDLQPDVGRRTLNERLNSSQNRQSSSRKRRSPPINVSSTPLEAPKTSPQLPRSSGSSALTSALNRQSIARLSTHVSHSSAASDSAMTDESSAEYSPVDRDTMLSPPTTPPQSDFAAQNSQNRATKSTSNVSRTIPRTEPSSGAWKKMGLKIFGQKKKPSEQ